MPGLSHKNIFLRRIRNFCALGNSLIDLLLELLSQGLHIRFDEDPARVDGQLDHFQAASGDFAPTVEGIAQKRIISLWPANRHFSWIDAGHIGKECAIVDVFYKFFLGSRDVPVGIPLEDMIYLDL